MKWLLLSTFAFFGTAVAEPLFPYKVTAFNTHRPVLYEVAQNTTGPIVEFGCGEGSTDVLHEVCKQTGRLLISIDDNLDWLMKYAAKYLGDGYNYDNSGWHKFIFIPGKNANDPDNAAHWIRFLNECELIKTTEFDLCFIDQSPWLGRFETLKAMKGRSKYVMVHDCDFFPAHGFFGKVITPITKNTPGTLDFSDVFRYFKVYFPIAPWPCPSGPPTLLGSDVDPNLPEIDFTKY